MLTTCMPVGDGPAQPGGEHRPPGLQVPAQHPHAVERSLGGDPADDPGAGGAVAEDVVVGSLDHPHLALGSGAYSSATPPASGPDQRDGRLSMPLSMTATLTPAPVAPPQAHSLVIGMGSDERRRPGTACPARTATTRPGRSCPQRYLRRVAEVADRLIGVGEIDVDLGCVGCWRAGPAPDEVALAKEEECCANRGRCVHEPGRGRAGPEPA